MLFNSTDESVEYIIIYIGGERDINTKIVSTINEYIYD